MDIIIFLVLIIIVLLIFRDTSVIVYFIGTADVALKLIHFIKVQLGIKEVTSFVNTYIPSSVMGIIESSTSGLATSLLAWLYIAVMIMFVVYLCRYIFKLR